MELFSVCMSGGWMKFLCSRLEQLFPLLFISKVPSANYYRIGNKENGNTPQISFEFSGVQGSTCIECHLLWRRKDAKVLRNELRRSARKISKKPFSTRRLCFWESLRRNSGRHSREFEWRNASAKFKLRRSREISENYFENSVTSASLTPHCLHKSLM